MFMKTESVTFPPAKGTGPRKQSVTVTFERAVTRATAVLTGHAVGYSDHNDHELGEIIVGVSVLGYEGTNVTVEARLGVRDWSGSWDDRYDGTVEFAVFAE